MTSNKRLDSMYDASLMQLIVDIYEKPDHYISYNIMGHHVSIRPHMYLTYERLFLCGPTLELAYEQRQAIS